MRSKKVLRLIQHPINTTGQLLGIKNKRQNNNIIENMDKRQWKDMQKPVFFIHEIALCNCLGSEKTFPVHKI